MKTLTIEISDDCETELRRIIADVEAWLANVCEARTLRSKDENEPPFDAAASLNPEAGPIHAGQPGSQA